MLRVKKGEYLLYVKSTAYDANGIPMYVGIQLINGERFSLMFMNLQFNGQRPKIKRLGSILIDPSLFLW